MHPLIFYPLLLISCICLCLRVFRDNANQQLWQHRSAHAGGRELNVTTSSLFVDDQNGDIIDFSIHPIDNLIVEANRTAEQLLSQHTNGSDEAASAYRKRRGRHPPPGWREWVTFAETGGAVMIESMFDQIYEDLEPFWAITPSTIRSQAASWPMILSTRYGRPERRGTLAAEEQSSIASWEALLAEVPEGYLPDVDLAMNPDEEPHLFVPFETMTNYYAAAEKTRYTSVFSESRNISNHYAQYNPLLIGSTFRTFGDTPPDTPIWDLTRAACPSESLARSLDQDKDFSSIAKTPFEHKNFSRSGFISNWTEATSPCSNPQLQNLHGYFINAKESSAAFTNEAHPYSTDRLISRHLFPIFSGSKLRGVNADILLPSPKYLSADYNNDYFFEDESELPWDNKSSTAIWRGAASGGVNSASTWTRFHRHRFVSMLNGTQVSLMEDALDAPKPEHVPGGEPAMPYNFPLPNDKLYPLASRTHTRDLGHWVNSFSDGAFTDLRCDPPASARWTHGKYCWYNDAYYRTRSPLPQSRMQENKFLPSIDGDSIDGDYLSHLRSGSLPIKATVFAEWHDSRLIPWKHFVPMDSSYADWWGIMEYFLGYEPLSRAKGLGARPKKAHDEVARQIAEDGRDWAAKVLRREDMVLYAWRVVLEYARICDERREQMGWTDDLVRDE